MSAQRAIYFVRHGQRQDKVDPTWRLTATKWDNTPLSSHGHVQQSEVGRRLNSEKIDVIVCSPFTRCVQSAAAIMGQLDVQPKMVIEPGLGEALNACMDPPGSLKLDEVRAIIPSVDGSYVPVFTDLPKEADGHEGCVPRMEATMKGIRERFPEGNLLIVSHASPIGACHEVLVGTYYYVGVASIGRINEENGKFSCEYWNTWEHLSDPTNLREHGTKPFYSSPRDVNNNSGSPLRRLLNRFLKR